MKFIILIFLFLRNIDCMGQFSFKKAVNELYFGVEMNMKPIDEVLLALRNVNKLKYIGTSNSHSLSDNLRLGIGNKILRTTYLFQMLESPVSGNEIISGYIKISVGMSKGTNKLLDIEWGLELENEAKAKKYLDDLSELFIPNSTNYSIEDDDEIQFAKYAQFSNSKLNKNTIRNIGFFLSKNIGTGKFEIRLFHYNNFMK